MRNFTRYVEAALITRTPYVGYWRMAVTRKVDSPQAIHHKRRDDTEFCLICCSGFDMADCRFAPNPPYANLTILEEGCRIIVEIGLKAGRTSLP